MQSDIQEDINININSTFLLSLVVPGPTICVTPCALCFLAASSHLCSLLPPPFSAHHHTPGIPPSHLSLYCCLPSFPSFPSFHPPSPQSLLSQMLVLLAPAPGVQEEGHQPDVWLHVHTGFMNLNRADSHWRRADRFMKTTARPSVFYFRTEHALLEIYLFCLSLASTPPPRPRLLEGVIGGSGREETVEDGTWNACVHLWVGWRWAGRWACLRNSRGPWPPRRHHVQSHQVQKCLLGEYVLCCCWLWDVDKEKAVRGMSDFSLCHFCVDRKVGRYLWQHFDTCVFKVPVVSTAPIAPSTRRINDAPAVENQAQWEEFTHPGFVVDKLTSLFFPTHMSFRAAWTQSFWSCAWNRACRPSLAQPDSVHTHFMVVRGLGTDVCVCTCDSTCEHEHVCEWGGDGITSHIFYNSPIICFSVITVLVWL